MTKKRLFLALSPSTIDWLALDESGTVTHTTGQGELSSFVEGYEITAIIPGEDVLLTQAELPKLNRQRLLQALPFALEEQLIDDVQQLHFAIADYQEDGRLPVAIIHREKIKYYLDMLEKQGIAPHYMIPATLSLTYTPKHWEFAFFESICLVRMGKYQGFACDPANLNTLLSLHSEKPECLQIHNFCDKPIDFQYADIPANIMQHHGKSFLEITATTLNQTETLNLLQGEYATKQNASLTKKIILISASMLASWVGILFIGKIVSYFILQSALHQTDIAINKIYKKHFPAATSVVAPRERMEQKLKQTNNPASNSMLGLLGLVGNSLHSSPQIHVKQFDFREKSLALNITANSFDSLDQFTKSLKKQGLTVKQQSAGMADSEAKATLYISMGAT